jgi:hypothetical protein
MKSKMRKYEIGTHNTTENRAEQTIINHQVDEWFTKITTAERRVGLPVENMADVLVGLINEVKAGKTSREVIDELMKRKPMLASLERAKIRCQTRR